MNNRLILYIFVLVNLCTCSKNPTKNGTADYSLRYNVSIPSMSQDSLYISLSIQDWEHGDSVRLLAPPVYADNPLLEQTKTNFCNVTINNTKNTPISFTRDSVQVGLHKSLALSFPKSALPVTVAYDMKFQYVTQDVTIPIPHIHASSGYLQGSYLFVIPYKSKNITDIWRDNFDLQVNYVIGAGVTLKGDPVSKASFKNPYELMFATSALGGDLLINDRAGGQSYQVINLDNTKIHTGIMLDKVRDDFALLLRDITAQFGTIDQAPLTVILGVNKSGGLEGMHAFSIIEPQEDDSLGVFNMVLVHEIIHSWIGIRVGDYDDPWWKEGTSNYLGFLIAKRNELCAQSFLEKALLEDISDTLAVTTYTMTSDYVRENLFNPALAKGLGKLVYTKGAQVSMLLDRRIREVSGNAVTLDQILGKFVKLYDGSAFYRSEYTSFIKSQSNADVSDIFSRYVDTPGAIPDSVLQENYAKLAAMGAFGNIIVAKRAEVAPYIRVSHEKKIPVSHFLSKW